VQGDVGKWRHRYAEESSWDTARYRSIQRAEARLILNWLAALKLPRYDILEIGCGSGNFGLLLCQGLLESGLDFTCRLTDLLPEAVQETKDRFAGFSRPDLVEFWPLDVYEILETLGRSSQSLIISTGHASAVSYKWAVPLVSESLAQGGFLICDFINHFAPHLFWRNPAAALKRLAQVRRRAYDPDFVQYQFGRVGLRKYFQAQGLKMVKLTGLGWLRYPLVGLFVKTGPASPPPLPQED